MVLVTVSGLEASVEARGEELAAGVRKDLREAYCESVVVLAHSMC